MGMGFIRFEALVRLSRRLYVLAYCHAPPPPAPFYILSVARPLSISIRVYMI